MLQPEYTTLFNAITDAINILVAAQQRAEELVIDGHQPTQTLSNSVPATKSSAGMPT
jgi:hypothetical protein